MKKNELKFLTEKHWPKVKLGDICILELGKTPPSKESKYWAKVSGYNWFSISDMGIDNLRETGRKVTQLAHDITFQGKIRPVGTLIMSFKLTIGKVKILDFPAFHNEAIVAITPKDDRISKQYLLYTLPTLVLAGKSKKAIKGDTLNSTSLKNLEIPLPLPEIQKQIVIECKKVETQQKRLLNFLQNEKNDLIKLRESLLTRAIRGELTNRDPQDGTAEELYKQIQKYKEEKIKAGELKKSKASPTITPAEIPFEIPETWKWVRLGDLSNLITKGSSPKWQGVSYTNKSNGVLFITSENVLAYKIDLKHEKYVESKFNEIEPRSILKKGDFLMNIVGASIGRTARFELDVTANINQATCLIRMSGLLNKDYFSHFFNSKVCQNYMFEGKVENARANLSMINIANFLIPLPPLLEQQKIVDAVETEMKRIDELENLNAENTALAKKMLNRFIEEILFSKPTF